MMKFPWARAMELGLGHLRLSPRDFWAMTLPELSAALGGSDLGRAQAITRQSLASLCRTYPD